MATEYMVDFITGKSDEDLTGFITTNHTGKRGLKGYDDNTFDSINRKAFDGIKNSKIIDFYNETEADQIKEALSETIRGPQDDLTMKDALEGNARNFFTTLDLEDPNVMRAIGQYGFAQAISVGGMLKPVKALLMSEGQGNNRVLTEDAKNWQTRQMLEGLKDAQLTYYSDAANRMLSIEYYEDMKELIGDKIELTNNEHDAFGREFTNWAANNKNMPEIPVEERSDLKGEVYYQLPKPGDKYVIGMSKLSNEDVGTVLDVIRELALGKWKNLMKKAVNGLIKLDGLKPNVVGITPEELETILGGAERIKQELTTELNNLVDEVDESGMPKQMVAGRRGTRERVTPGNLSSDKPDFRRDFRGDKSEEWNRQNPKSVGESGEIEQNPEPENTFDPSNLTSERDIQIIETVDKNDIIKELTPITTLKQFVDNSTIDVRVNKKSKVYTVTTDEEDWNLYEDFLGVTDADKAVMKISSPGKFSGKMKLDLLGEDIEETEEGFSVEVIREMLKTKEVDEKLFTNIKDSLNSILDGMDVILRYYYLVTQKDDVDNKKIDEIIKDLETYLGSLSEEELLDLLKNYNGEKGESLRGFLRPFNTLLGNINNDFISHTENVRESKEEQIRSDEEAEEIEVESETQEDLTDIQTNTAIETFEILLEAYENSSKKLRDYRPPEDSMEDLQNAMDEFLATPAGLTFKNKYVEVLDGVDLNEMNKPAVLQKLEEHFNLKESKLDKGSSKIIESLITDDILQQYELVDIFTNIITGDSTNPKEWTQMAKYTSAGKIQFRLIFTVGETGTKTQAEIIYNQQFQIKPTLNERSSRIDFTTERQQRAASIDRKGGQRSVTALGREIKQNGFGTNIKRKEFIDKVVERLQQLEMVI